jgi:hypothetical protein
MSILANSNAIESGGYNIERSLRFRASASAYLNRTPASASNRKTWTWSGWVKRGALTTSGTIFGLFQGYSDANNRSFLFLNNGGAEFGFVNSVAGVSSVVSTTADYRDPSAWYHLMAVADTTQATAANRIKLYVNGSEVTALRSASYPSQNTDMFINSNIAHYLGNDASAANRTFDGYMAEINFIDGQALTPSSFGSTNSITGVWQPAKYTGTYGTNGFYLPFTDTSSTTNLVKDSSGNANNWTPNNISLTAGTTYDSMTDVPTLTSATAANYAVWNPNKVYSSNFTLTNGNLTATDTSSNISTRIASMAIPLTGKYYFEITATTISASLGFIGVIDSATANGNTAFQINGAYRSGGQIYNLAGTAQTSGSSYTSGDVIGVAVDVTSGTVQFYKNNVAQGATPSFSFTAGTELYPYIATDNNAGTKTFNANFGQRPFSYTPPTGFVALNTFNLPTPSILKGSQYMNAVTYTGTGSSQSLTGVGFQPDLVWIKGRSGATDHGLYDAVRGVQKQLESNTTTDETTETTGLTAFGSDGFTVGALAQLNTSTATYVAWNWKENATAGFDIVTYTGNGSARTISHSLGVAPSMIIVKARTTASTDQGWPVYHAANTSDPKTDYLLLNTTDATADLDTVWNDTAPTSSVFSVGTNANVNANNDTYVAYCWAEIAGFSRFGSYTGNGSTDGPFVFTGFRPKFVLIKCFSTTSNWQVIDTARSTYNEIANIVLYPNSSSTEGGSGYNFDVVSNGFKLRNSGTDYNTSTATYIYMAFAENPFKNALAR